MGASSAAAVLHDVNWCAFGLAILNQKLTVERALDYISGTELVPQHDELTNADIEDMISMRNQMIPMSYKRIGEIYGICESAVWRRIKRYEKKSRNALNKKLSVAK